MTCLHKVPSDFSLPKVTCSWHTGFIMPSELEFWIKWVAYIMHFVYSVLVNM
jgi:hypothetical protein